MFRLFVAGNHHRSRAAIRSVEESCLRLLGSTDSLEIVDVLEAPEMAEALRVFATPTLVRVLPLPAVRLVGDMSDKNIVDRLFEFPGSQGLPV